MNKLLIICGPTATGKTALAVMLAKKFNGELVSADSRQVYKGMDIGTGKDRDKDIPIWMYDVASPDEEFSVSHYQKLAMKVIDDIISRGKLPIVVGGTGLYIQSLIQPIDTIDIPQNTSLRKQLARLTLRELQKKLRTLDKCAWDKMNTSDRHNPRRLMRKIEIASYKGKGRMTHRSPSKEILSIGLTAPLSLLYKRIDDRVDKRVNEGIIEEIKGLLKQGYSWDLPAMSGLGYREWRTYFQKSSPKAEIIQHWKYDEHAYARRQMTWFRKRKNIHWFDVSGGSVFPQVTRIVREWYT